MENRTIFYGDIPKTERYNDINSYFNKYYIGGSDIAELTVYGYAAPNDNASWIHRPLHYGGDGEYHAHIIRADGTPIPEHYRHRFTFYDRAVITEDSGDMVTIYGKQINFYRAGEMGTLIAVTKFENEAD